jgi:ABC-type transporter Mla subunit MlaD
MLQCNYRGAVLYNIKKGAATLENQNIEKTLHKIQEELGTLTKGQQELAKTEAETQDKIGELFKGQEKLFKGQAETQDKIEKLFKGQEELFKGQAETQDKIEKLFKGQEKLFKGQEELAKNQKEMQKEIGETAKTQERILDILDAHRQLFARGFEKMDELHNRISRAEMNIEHKIDDNIKALWDKSDILSQELKDLKLRVSCLEGTVV